MPVASGVKMIDRPRMFTDILKRELQRVSSQFWAQGPGRVGGYKYPATRKRVRALARKMAREEMRAVRRVSA